jgi:hypothetical protein
MTDSVTDAEIMQTRSGVALPSNRGTGWDSAGSASTVTPVWSSVRLVTELGSTDVSDVRKERRPDESGRSGHFGAVTQ